MGGACRVYGRGDWRIQGFGGETLKERDHLGDPGVDGRMKLTFWLRDAPTSLTFNNCTLCAHCIYVLYLSENKQRFVPLTA
jgi:hypothetical protein